MSASELRKSGHRGNSRQNTFLRVQTVEFMENSPIDITKINLCRNDEAVRKEEKKMVCEIRARG